MDVPCRWAPARMAGPGKRWRTDELADDGPFVMMWDYWITGLLATLPLMNRREDEACTAWRRLSVPELRGIELHECDRDSGARAGQSPQSEHGRRKQPGSLRIMNHDGTRLSRVSHGSIEVKQTGGNGTWKRRPRSEKGQGQTTRRTVAVSQGVGSETSSQQTTDGSGLGSGQCCLPPFLPPSGPNN